MVWTLKRALAAAKVDKKIPGLHCPGQPGLNPQPALILRHYALLFAFDII